MGEHPTVVAMPIAFARCQKRGSLALLKHVLMKGILISTVILLGFTTNLRPTLIPIIGPRLMPYAPNLELTLLDQNGLRLNCQFLLKVELHGHSRIWFKFQMIFLKETTFCPSDGIVKGLPKFGAPVLTSKLFKHYLSNLK